MNKALVILVGGVTGMAAGVVAALLLAPQSGSDVRRTIREGAMDWGSTAKRGLSKGRLRMTELVNLSGDLAKQARDRASDVTSTLRDRASDVSGAIREQAGRARGVVESRQQEASEGIAERTEDARRAVDILTQATEALGKAQAALEAIRRVRE